jgi:hypothetical protein
LFDLQQAKGFKLSTTHNHPKSLQSQRRWKRLLPLLGWFANDCPETQRRISYFQVLCTLSDDEGSFLSSFSECDRLWKELEAFLAKTVHEFGQVLANLEEHSDVGEERADEIHSRTAQKRKTTSRM